MTATYESYVRYCKTVKVSPLSYERWEGLREYLSDEMYQLRRDMAGVFANAAQSNGLAQEASKYQARFKGRVR